MDCTHEIHQQSFFQGNTVDFSFSHVFPGAAAETCMEILGQLQNYFFLFSSLHGVLGEMVTCP